MQNGPIESDTLSPQDTLSLLTATGRRDLADALHWIAEARPLVEDLPVADILAALVAAADAGVPGSVPALRAAVRASLSSTLDTSADLVLTETIVKPHQYEVALENVARRTSTGSLSSITPAAVLAAQAEDPLVIQALSTTAGLSWRDLQARSQAQGVTLPGEPDGNWNPSQVQSAFMIIDDIVSGRVNPQIDGAVSARPIELLLNETTGWSEIEKFRTGGITYGTLLAQRDVGSAWSAHRNRTNSEISRLMVRRVLAAFDDADVNYWSTEGCDAVSKQFLGTQVGVRGKTPGQLSVVTRRSGGSAGYAVLIAIARDGGTARKTAATLATLPERFKVPAILVLFGTGWADRGESDDLVRAFGGRLYTEHTLTDLARLAGSVGPD